MPAIPWGHAMKIVYDFPPNYAEIEAAFGSLRGRGVLFCYGDSIYALDGQKVSPALIAHESVHSARQGSNPAAWWEKYISDVTFRYNEEVAANIAEYSWHLQNSSGRNDRRKWLAIVSARLTQPLYRFGPLVTKAKAKDALRAGYEACVTQANATTNFEARKKLAE